MRKYEEPGSVKNRSGQGRSESYPQESSQESKIGRNIDGDCLRLQQERLSRTIERSLKESGLRRLVVQQKRKDSPVQEEKLLDSQRKWLHLTGQMSFFFVDEKTFQLSGGR